MELWFISDTHFGHKAMLKFMSPDGTLMRPFDSVEEMDELMVQRWNEVVRPSDHVYHLGDVTMRREFLPIVKRLNGHKRLIFGNHDIYEYQHYANVGFKKLMSYRKFGNIVFSHIPIHPMSLGKPDGAEPRWNAHGHVHTNGSPQGRYVNLCVELTNYRPLALYEVRKQIEERQSEQAA